MATQKPRLKATRTGKCESKYECLCYRCRMCSQSQAFECILESGVVMNTEFCQKSLTIPLSLTDRHSHSERITYAGRQAPAMQTETVCSLCENSAAAAPTVASSLSLAIDRALDSSSKHTISNPVSTSASPTALCLKFQTCSTYGLLTKTTLMRAYFPPLTRIVHAMTPSTKGSICAFQMSAYMLYSEQLHAPHL